MNNCLITFIFMVAVTHYHSRDLKKKYCALILGVHKSSSLSELKSTILLGWVAPGCFIGKPVSFHFPVPSGHKNVLTQGLFSSLKNSNVIFSNLSDFNYSIFLFYTQRFIVISLVPSR